MPKYKVLKYCSVIDALRWLAFDVEPVSKEDEEILISRGKRRPLKLSSQIIVSGSNLGKIRYGSENENIKTKESLSKDDIELQKQKANLVELLKKYPVDISGILFSKYKNLSKQLTFQLQGKNIFIETANRQVYEIGYTVLRKRGKILYVRSKIFYETKINFKQLKSAFDKRFNEEKENLDLRDCQTRIKAISEFLKSLPSMSRPDAVHKIWRCFGKTHYDKGFSRSTLNRYCDKIRNTDNSHKFYRAPQGNYKK